MGNSSGRDLLRAQVGTPVLYRIFNIAFGLLFAGVLLVTILNNRFHYIEFKWYWLLLCAAVGVGIFYLLYLLVRLLPDVDSAIEGAIVAILFVAFMALQLYAGWSLRVEPSQTWDFGVVFSSAQDYVLNGVKPAEYFLYFPNNAGLYVFWVGFMSIFKQMGMQDFTAAALVLNILVIDLAIYLLYRTARMLFGLQKGLLALLAAFATLPFILYVPVYYTDTLSLVFPIAGVYLWLKNRGEWRAGEFGKAIVRFALLSALLGLGALLKASVLIVWVAIVFDLLFFLCGKGRLRMLLAGLGSVLVVYLGGGWLVRHSGALPTYNYAESIPFTHWIMMGLGGNGGYNDIDYQFTLAAAADKSGRMAANLAQIGRRLSDMGFGGTVTHLVNKLAYTFGDGTYTAVYKLDWSAVEPGGLHNFFVYDGRYVGFTGYASYAVQAAMLVGMVVAGVKSVLRKNDCLTFVRIAVFGLVLFLLVWETRARYLVNFLPLMILCSLEAFPTPKPAPPQKRQRNRREPAPDTAQLAEVDTAELGFDEEMHTAAPAPEPPPAPQREKAEPAQVEKAVEPQPPQQMMPTESEPTGNLFDLFAGEQPHALTEELATRPQTEELSSHLDNSPTIQFQEVRGPKEEFDVPKGDPFFELASTIQWDLEDLEAAQKERAQEDEGTGEINNVWDFE